MIVRGWRVLDLRVDAFYPRDFWTENDANVFAVGMAAVEPGGALPAVGVTIVVPFEEEVPNSALN